MAEQLPKYFDSQVRLLTTPCALIETEKLGPEVYGAVQVLKSLQLYKCPHAETPVHATKCIKFIVKQFLKPGQENCEKFVIASQDNQLRSHLRKLPGVPLLHLSGCVPSLEKPSEANRQYEEKMETKKLEVLNYQKEILTDLKVKSGIGKDNVVERKGTKKRKREGPNPLSCKKSKKRKRTADSKHDDTEPQQDKKRKRKRIKLPAHVKHELVKISNLNLK